MASHFSAEYWSADNQLRETQGFNWGGLHPEDLVTRLDKVGLPVRKDGTKLRMMIAGAGTSSEPAYLRDHIPGLNIWCVDFDEYAVNFQKSKGMQAFQLDLVDDFKEDQRHKFDVVYDASFLDVFMSTWGTKDIVQFDNPQLRKALRNLKDYLRPGGLFVVKSIIATVDDFDLLWQVCFEGFSAKKAIAMAKRASNGSALLAGEGTYRLHLEQPMEVDEVVRLTRARGGGQPYITRGGRRTTKPSDIGFLGHVGFWRCKEDDVDSFYTNTD